ncbi:MAG: hypothetical protein ACI81S_001401, partial [Sphingobacteriales bacterium]
VFEGLLRMKDEKITQYKNPSLNVNSDIINEIKPGPFGRIWMGTEDGIIIFNPRTEKVEMNFSSNDTELPHPQVFSLFIDTIGQTAYFGTWGGGLAIWEYGNDPEFMAVMATENTPKNEFSFELYQNDKSLIFNFPFPRNESILVEVFSLNGQKILSQNLNINSHQIRLPTDLPSGVYSVVVKQEGVMGTRKIILR